MMRRTTMKKKGRPTFASKLDPVIDIDEHCRGIELDAETKALCNKLRARLATPEGWAHYSAAAQKIDLSDPNYGDSNDEA
jgi:hypothetical protein